MTLSGSYNFVESEQIDVITEAYERVGRNPASLSSQDIDSARRSINYLFSDWSNDGPNLWEVDLVTLPLNPLQREYTLDVETVSILQAYTRITDPNTGTLIDLMIQPISRAEYAALPNKDQESSRPTQFYFQRTSTPSLFVWPVPQSANVELRYYRMKIQQDAGAFTNSLDVPNRWMEAIASGLAAKLAVKFAPERLSYLQGLAEQAYVRAKAEDRERVPLRISIDNWGY
jgi:hypothetical protein